MDVHLTTLCSGIRLPYCSVCQGHLFYRDLPLKYRLDVRNDEQLELSSPSLPVEVVGRGVRTCNIMCANCLQRAHREGLA